MGERVWAAAQIFSVSAWLLVWCTEVPASPWMPLWLQIVGNVAMFLYVARSIWRGQIVPARTGSENPHG